MDLKTKDWFKDWICEDQFICEGLEARTDVSALLEAAPLSIESLNGAIEACRKPTDWKFYQEQMKLVNENNKMVEERYKALKAACDEVFK